MSSLFHFLQDMNSFDAGIKQYQKEEEHYAMATSDEAASSFSGFFWSEAVEMAKEAILVPLHLERACAQSENMTK